MRVIIAIHALAAGALVAASVLAIRLFVVLPYGSEFWWACCYIC